MRLTTELQSCIIGNTQLSLYAPTAQAVQLRYANNKEDAYWAKVWPASIGLCRFLQEHPQYIKGKKILELAAGLGLPGLYAARIAKEVRITDREQQATLFVKKSAQYLGYLNVTAFSLNWSEAAQQPLPDVVLMSDVNYEPAVFDELKKVLEYFLEHTVTVIISTPQRLIAKQFVVQLLPFSALQWQTSVAPDGHATEVSVFVLQRKLST